MGKRSAREVGLLKGDPITIGGEALEQRLFCFRLPYTGWCHVEVIHGGESFVALSEAIQNTLLLCGGVSAEHRTESAASTVVIRARFNGCRRHPQDVFRSVKKRRPGSLGQHRYHPARSFSAQGMSASASPSAGALQLRLSEQMQALSLVSETLTLRLLELEERLSALEGQLEGLQHLQSNTLSHDSADLLTATEERIARLEDLLTEQSAPQRASVHPLQRPQPEASAQDTGFNEPELELNPFPEEEEEEQPFMDELSA